MSQTPIKPRLAGLRAGVYVADTGRQVRVDVALRALGIQDILRASSLNSLWRSLAERKAHLLLLEPEPEAMILDLVNRLRDPRLTPCPHIQIMLLTHPLNAAAITRWVKVGVDYICSSNSSPVALATRIEHLVANPIKALTLPGYVGPCRRRLPSSAYGDAYKGKDRRQRVDAKVPA